MPNYRLYKNDIQAAYIFLFELELENETLRYCKNTEDIIHNTNTYYARGMTAPIPDQRQERLTSVSIQLDNTDRELSFKLRSHTGSQPIAKVFTVFSDDLETIVDGPYNFIATAASTRDANTVEINLSHEDLLNSAYPKLRFTPHFFPALFRTGEVIQ